MGVLGPLNSKMQKLADEHRQWLSSFDPQHLANWERLLKADDESAMTEAAVRRILHSHHVNVEPNEKLTGTCGGPDFRCAAGASHFYVEVTCISIATAERRTGVKDGPTGGDRPLKATGMTEAIFAECQNKAPQCGNLDGPALVALGTFHSTAAMFGFAKVLVNCVLTGKTKMAWDIDIETGQKVGDTYQTTELQAAAFMRPDKTQEIGFARNSISGVLLCPVGLPTMRTIGVLHPNPARPFDPAMLPGIEFGQVEIDRSSRELRVRWPNGNDD